MRSNICSVKIEIIFSPPLLLGSQKPLASKVPKINMIEGFFPLKIKLILIDNEVVWRRVGEKQV